VEEGCSCRKIARTLTERGVATPGGSDHWRESTVNRILRQPAYMGTFLYRRHEYVEPDHAGGFRAYRKNRKTARRVRPREDWIEVPVPAIITPEVFEAAQRRLAENAVFSPRNNKRHEYLLKGLGRCGAAMSGSASRGRRYYGCSAFDPHNVGERKACRPRPTIDADWLEHEVWNAISERFRNADLLREEFERRLAEVGAASPDDLREQEARKSLASIKRQQDRLLDAYQLEEIDRDELNRRLAELNRRRRDAEAILHDIGDRQEERRRLKAIPFR
jgi:site-specific DNA recombinase